MKKFTGAIVFLLFICLAGCTYNHPEEKQEVAYWAARVTAPAHEVLYRTNALEPALRTFDSLWKITGRNSLYLASAREIMKADYHLFITKNNDSTAAYIDAALRVLHSEKQQQQYPRTYVGYLIFGGEINFRLEKYAKSNEYFFRAKQLADLYLDPCERSSFIYNAAMVSYRQENYGQSSLYFREAFAAQASCPVQTTAIALQQQEIQSNIGLCFLHLKQYDSAMLHFSMALQLATRFRDSLGPKNMEKIRGVIDGHMAKVYAARDRLDSAERLYRQSIALNARPDYEQRHALQMQVDLATVYQRQKKYSDMRRTLDAIRAGLDSLPDAEAELGWHKLQYEYYDETEQPLAELAAFKEYIQRNDALAARKKTAAEADISRQLKEKEQAVQIAMLTRDNERKRYLLWISVTLALMAIVIIVLVYQHYKRGKKHILHLTRLNEEIRLKTEALQTANTEKDRILHVVAHDLRNPVGLVAYVSELVLMEDLDEKSRTSVQMIHEASQQALLLTNELLESHHANKELAKELLDFLQLVEKRIQHHRLRAKEKGQQIAFENAVPAVMIMGNADRLGRMVDNLLVNAIKFSPRNEAIVVQLEKQGREVLFSISDKGSGIPADEQQVVFNRFTTARKAGTNGEKSFGLGLSICKEITEEHGGTISLQSRPQTGTRVNVRLLLADNA